MLFRVFRIFIEKVCGVSTHPSVIEFLLYAIKLDCLYIPLITFAVSLECNKPVNKILEYVGQAIEPPALSPAWGPPSWDDYNQDISVDENGQPIPEYEFDQCVSWWEQRTNNNFLTLLQNSKFASRSFLVQKPGKFSQNKVFRIFESLLLNSLPPITRIKTAKTPSFPIYRLKNAIEFPIIHNYQSSFWNSAQSVAEWRTAVTSDENSPSP